MVLTGQGIEAKSHHPAVDNLSEAELRQRLGNMRNQVQRQLTSLPPHHEYLAARA